MAWCKYKPLCEIKWQEPYRITHLLNKIQEKSTPWWHRPLRGAVWSAILFVFFNFIKLKSISTGFVLLTSIATGFFIFYFISLMYYLSPRRIGLGKKALVTMAGGSSQGWLYEKMSKVEFMKWTLNEKEFDIMLITMMNSLKLILGVPQKVDPDQVIEFLRSKGIDETQIIKKPLEPTREQSQVKCATRCTPSQISC